MTGACLVTGGAGFIGCALSNELVQRFDQVVAVDCLHPQVHARQQRPTQLHKQVDLIVADISEAATWERVLDRINPQVIVHLAAETGTAQSLLAASRHASANVLGTTQMTDALARRGIFPRKIVLASSRAVYGEGKWQDSSGHACYPGMRTQAMLEAGQWDFTGLSALPQCSQDVQAHPANVYAATKLAQENLLAAWCGSLGVELTTFRLQNVYGPGQSLTNPYTGIVSMFGRWAKSGQVIPLYEDGRIIRDFVFITDVVDALLRGIEAPGTNTLAFDVGSGTASTIADLARETVNYYGAPAPEVTGQYRKGDVRAAWANISHTCKTLEWEPKVDLHQGVEALCRWIDTKGDA